MQYPLLTLLLPSELPQASSMFGAIVVIVNLTVTLAIAYTLTKAVRNNTILQRMLFVKSA